MTIQPGTIVVDRDHAIRYGILNATRMVVVRDDGDRLEVEFDEFGTTISDVVYAAEIIALTPLDSKTTVALADIAFRALGYELCDRLGVSCMFAIWGIDLSSETDR